MYMYMYITYTCYTRPNVPKKRSKVMDVYLKSIVWNVIRDWFYTKMLSYQYRKSHCGDKTILRRSYLHNGISYTGEVTSIYRIRALVTIRCPRVTIFSPCTVHLKIYHPVVNHAITNVVPLQCRVITFTSNNSKLRTNAKWQRHIKIPIVCLATQTCGVYGVNRLFDGSK